MGKRKSCFTREAFCGRETEASEMTESERAVIPQQTGPPSIFFIQERSGKDGGGKGVEEGAGWITEEPRASVSFLFIYSPCLFFFPHLQHPPPLLISSPIFNTLSLCPLSISRTPLPPSLPPSPLFSPPSASQGKRDSACCSLVLPANLHF